MVILDIRDTLNSKEYRNEELIFLVGVRSDKGIIGSVITRNDVDRISKVCERLRCVEVLLRGLNLFDLESFVPGATA